ncbi:hypothetical protein BJV82DRAFT_698719 [Fennellomyces sp. T-0311]|nr:hypothetical protein BJV82DRAFT_698719 [Fennellomyces sp. T-0311]
MRRTEGSINKPKKLHKAQATIHRYTTGQLPSAVPVEERRESIINSIEATHPSNRENSASRSISDKINGERHYTSADASPENDRITLEVLMREIEGDTRSNADETTTVDDDPTFHVDEPTGSDGDLVEAESVVLKEYFLTYDTSKYGMPGEYCRGSFWVEPPAPFFALRNQEDIDPTLLYYPRVLL